MLLLKKFGDSINVNMLVHHHHHAAVGKGRLNPLCGLCFTPSAVKT